MKGFLPTLLPVFACAFALAQEPPARGRAEHVVLVVWDGMRPDFVREETTPTLWQMSRDGVFFKSHHSVYITSTEVNGTALATGVYPNRSHIIANREYRPVFDAQNPIATESESSIRKGDAAGGYLGVATMEEMLQAAGHRTAIAGTKPVALLPDRTPGRTTDAAKNSTVIFSGKSIPAAAIDGAAQLLGAKFPAEVLFPNSDEDAWTTRALTEFLWKDGVPEFSLLWLSDPDFSQHNTAPGSPIALAALKSSDANLARVLAALDAKGVREKTDVLVVSDHGFSTVETAVDVTDELSKAGFPAVRSFKAPPQPGEIMVVGVGGSVLFYVTGHGLENVQRLVEFLQRSGFAGVIFTREKMSGTFTLEEARLNSPDAPDVVVSMKWSDSKNKYGAPGGIAGDNSRKPGKGAHSTLGRFDIHNTLVAAGPDFKRGFADEMPSANVDLAPTILWIFGIKPPAELDGRVLAEAMPFFSKTKPEPPPRQFTWTRERTDSGIRWRQYLKLTRFGGRVYLDEGNGGKP